MECCFETSQPNGILAPSKVTLNIRRSVCSGNIGVIWNGTFLANETFRPLFQQTASARSDRPALLALHDRVLDGEKNPCLLEDFPFEQACGRAGWPWRVPAARMFTNWLTLLRRQVG